MFGFDFFRFAESITTLLTQDRVLREQYDGDGRTTYRIVPGPISAQRVSVDVTTGPISKKK